MNKTVTSEAEILTAARTLLLEKGAAALNMRAVAAACGVAVGSIYNYFPSKGALVGATIESIWRDIFAAFTAAPQYDRFVDAAAALLEALSAGEERYSGFFSLHAFFFASADKAEGRARMNTLFSALRDKLVEALAGDAKVRAEVFSGALSPETFAGYVLTLAISKHLQPSDDNAALLAMIEHCIY
ncbi:MAG: TetR/AcrR family transcriptional regulator [Peptococcaceae bacterium]|nr:TetR/AcrR family transcriptional regulator [Peptococcaceae bacterium]